MRGGVQLACVPPDRLAQRVLGVPSALFRGGDHPQQPLPQPLGVSSGELRRRRRGQPCALGPPDQRRPPRGGRLRPGHALGRRPALFLGLLDLVPATLDLPRRPGGRHRRTRAGDGAPACRRGRRRRRRRRSPAPARPPAATRAWKSDLQQHVTQLLAHGRRVVVDDRVVGLVGLLEEVAVQRGVRLLGVPGTAARRAQPVHDRDHVEQPGPGGSGAPATRGTPSQPAGLLRGGQQDGARGAGRGGRRGVGDVGDVDAVLAQRGGGRGGAGQGEHGRCGGDRAPAGRGEQAGQTGADGDEERDGHPRQSPASGCRPWPGVRPRPRAPSPHRRPRPRSGRRPGRRNAG